MAGLLDLFTGNQNGAGILGLPPNVAGPLQNAFSPLQAALQQIATPGLLAQQQASQQFNQMLPQLLGQQQPIMPSAAPQMPAPAAPTGDMALPRGYRNNNPLNIEDGPFAKSQPGYAGSDGRFAKFAALDQGSGAASNLLDVYQNKHGLNTVRGIISRWAPASDGNNVNAYADNVAKRLGISPDAPVPPEMRQQLIAAMAQHENGRPMPQGAQAAPQQMAQAQPAMPPKVMGLIRMLSIPNLPDAQKRVAETLLQNELLQSRGTDDIKEFEYARRQGFTGTLEQWVQRKRHGGGEFGLQLFWGRDAQGNPVAMQPGKSGEAVQTKLPPGVSLSSKEAQKLDAGTHWVLIDPLTRQQVGIVPKNIAEKEEAEKVGAARGTAKVALPAAETTTNRAIKMLDQLEKHPGFSQGVGFIVGRLPALTPQAADFRERVEQIDAMVFGEAVEVMRGLGALTDKEGPKVSAARARLKTAKSEEDFRTALKDIRDVFNDGIANMRKKAGMSSGQVSDPLGIR